MSSFGCLLLVSVIGASVAEKQDIRLPPTIIKGPVQHEIYRDEAVFLMECVATSTLKIDYSWKYNGAGFSLNAPNIKIPRDGTGTFTIDGATTIDAGYYQCFASNQWGTAVSNTSHLQMSYLSGDGGSSQTVEVTATEGEPFRITALPPKCFPPATYNWEIGRLVDDSAKTVPLSSRVQTDSNGYLYFAYVKKEDQTADGYVYKRAVVNTYMDVRKGTSYTKFIVMSGVLRQFRPTTAFVSKTPVAAVEGRNVSIRCFFSGNPEPGIQFGKEGGSLPIGRHKIQNFNTELFITNVQPTDEGDYYCSASNTEGTHKETIQINVQAAPVFRQWSDRPQNINVTDGDDVVFRCNAAAEPEAKIVWMRNGVKFDDKETSLPAKFSLSGDQRSLTVRGVCKDCQDGGSDLQVIQCNASNEHGYAFASGYINVLLKTDLVNSSEIRVTVYMEQKAFFEFECSGWTDDSTPMSLIWYHKAFGDDVRRPVRNVTDKVIVRDDGSLIIQLRENDTDTWAKYGGEYWCNVSNGYSYATRYVNIDVEDLPVAAVGTASILDNWWFLVIIGVACLLLLVVLLTVYCIYNRGDTYPVDQKERKTGNNPDDELIAFGFHDYQRPLDKVVSGSRATLSSKQRLNSDDGASLNEYGDDVGKFTEDGSFVGLYTPSPLNQPISRSGSQSQI